MQASGIATGAGAKKKSRFPQYAAAVIVNVLYISYSLADTSRFEVAQSLKNYTDLNDEEKAEAMQKDMGLTFCIAGLLSFPVYGLMFEKFSRKICAYVIGVTYIINSILLLCANSYELFHVAQFFLAISAAGTTIISPIYISEIAQDDIRGALQAINVLMYNIGFLLATFVVHFFPKYSLSWVTFVPTAIVFLCFHFWLPETPIYFLRRDDTDEAGRSLQWLRGSAADVPQEIENTKAVLKATRSDSQTTTTVFQDFFQKRTLGYCAVVTVLCLTDHFSGFTATGFELEALLKTLNPNHSSANDFLQYIIYMVGNVIVILICDRKGRKTALLISTVVCAVTLIANGICYHVIQNAANPDEPKADEGFGAAKIFALIFSLVHVMSYNIGIGVLSAVVIADIFPPKMLNTQLAINGIISWPFTYVINDLFYRTVKAAIHASGAFWVYSGCCAVGALFIYKFLPETKSRPAGYLLMDNRDDVVLGRFQ
ncbi:hypothetical protein R5R35_008054 [Gryllus longicercus]|uniref:Major facilitator superfamily (MFS) profile domain-containing protein n=1 Tax=Gryllus longicercus TaxID=2509291 RepID=A0AAN9W0F5_9ORTH